MLSYQKIIAALPQLHPQGRNALLIGLGGGYIAMAFAAQGIATDALELDPEVAKAAQQYFLYEPSGTLRVGDARYEIRRLNQQYDLIVHDFFTGGSVPSHLLSVEMLGDLDRLLKDDGLLALNFVGFTEGPEAAAAAAVYRTLGEVYPHRLALVSLPGEAFNDFVFLASQQPISLDAAADWLAAHEYPMPAEGELITDDFNSLERLQVAKAERYRALLLERMGPMLLAF